ncbi:MAG: serine/threonine protein kinase [Cyanobacteria bacterium RM1_2_2]|nr:serine/threonine protein kinase [Cyanobacteria bacterium RM1_2_2]
MSNGIPPRYVPTGKVLTGGMGEVLICQDTSLEREVAIKFIQNVGDQRRLFDEIAALQKIRSKHVVQIFDAFLNEVDRRIGIIQEYVSGNDLTSFLGKESISLNEYLKVLYQIASGISDIHAQGLIHRDIKPNNMKFDQSNIIKIFDFGLARFSGRNDSTLGFAGTPGFAAPELYRSGLVPFTNAVDTYAFGITAWYLSGIEIPEPLLRRPPDLTNVPSFGSLPLRVPQPIVNLLDRTLIEDLNDRPSMSNITNLLGNYLLKDKHRALLVYGRETYNLSKATRLVKLDVQNYGSLHIRYDGLNFLIDFVSGAVFVNNQVVQRGQLLPKDCVITLGDSSRGANRIFITFDISNPEVVL